MNRVFPAALAMLAASAAPSHGGDIRVVTKARVHGDDVPPMKAESTRFDISGSGWMDPTQLARLGRKNSRPKKTRR